MKIIYSLYDTTLKLGFSTKFLLTVTHEEWSINYVLGEMAESWFKMKTYFVGFNENPFCGSAPRSMGGEAKGTPALAFVCFPPSLPRISNGGSLDYFPKFIPPGLGCSSSSSSSRLSLSLSLNFSPRMGRNSLKLCLPSLARPPRLIPRPRRTID